MTLNHRLTHICLQTHSFIVVRIPLSSYTTDFTLACVFAFGLVTSPNMMPFVMVDFLSLESCLSCYMTSCWNGFINFIYNIFNIRSTHTCVWDHTRVAVESTLLMQYETPQTDTPFLITSTTITVILYESSWTQWHSKEKYYYILK